MSHCGVGERGPARYSGGVNCSSSARRAGADAIHPGERVILVDDLIATGGTAFAAIKLLERALAVDVNAKPEYRLVNLVMQRRARWLLSRIDDLILDPGKQEQNHTFLLLNSWKAEN